MHWIALVYGGADAEQTEFSVFNYSVNEIPTSKPRYRHIGC